MKFKVLKKLPNGAVEEVQQEGAVPAGGVGRTDLTPDVLADLNAARDALALRASSRSIVPHRSGRAVRPEHTASSIRASVAAGFDTIDLDLRMLSDGGIGVIHDADVAGVTTSAGAVSGLSTPQFRALTVDCSAWMGPGYPDEAPLTLRDVLGAFGSDRSIIWSIECKDSAAISPTIAALAEYGISPASVFPNSFSLPDCTKWADAGFSPAYIADPRGADFQALRSAGVAAVLAAADQAEKWTQALVASATSAGIVPWAYNVNTRTQMANQIAAGVTNLVSDDPEWLQAEKRQLRFDPYASKRKWRGHMAVNSPVNGGFIGSDAWGWGDSATGYYLGYLQGWACPVKGQDGATTFTLEFTLALDVVANDARWASVFFCMPNDTLYTDVPPYPQAGYHLLLRRSGSIELYSVAKGSGAGVLIGQVASPALTLGAEYRVRLTVTPGSIVVQNVTTGTTLGPVQNADVRGGYFQFGRNGAAARFRSVVVS